MAFHSGQKAVCIKKGPWVDLDKRETINYGPSFNQIVTIQEVMKSRFSDSDVLKLEGYDFWWQEQFFKPLESRKTSIEIFTKMLEPKNQRVI